jgi:hypothetical protein
MCTCVVSGAPHLPRPCVCVYLRRRIHTRTFIAPLNARVLNINMIESGRDVWGPLCLRL